MLELSDWFLLHDHLEEDNTALYLHQFIDRVRAAGLGYLGEADLTAINLGALPAGTVEGLDKVADRTEEMIRELQFLDLQQNRRFRMSLLCQPSQTPDHALSADRLWDFHWSTGLRPQAKIDSLAAAGQPLAFLGPLGDVRLRTTDPLSGAVFDTLCRQAGDGWPAAGEWHSAGGIKFGSIEVAEARFPLHFIRHEFRPDSGGAGQFRGGVGAELELAIETAEVAVANTAGDGVRYGSRGIAGGHDSKPHHYVLNPQSGNGRPLRTKEVGIELSPGDVLVIHSAGGGGWGDPAQRTAAQHAADRLAGLVTDAGEAA